MTCSTRSAERIYQRGRCETRTGYADQSCPGTTGLFHWEVRVWCGEYTRQGRTVGSVLYGGPWPPPT